MLHRHIGTMGVKTPVHVNKSLEQQSWSRPVWAEAQYTHVHRWQWRISSQDLVPLWRFRLFVKRQEGQLSRVRPSRPRLLLLHSLEPFKIRWIPPLRYWYLVYLISIQPRLCQPWSLAILLVHCLPLPVTSRKLFSFQKLEYMWWDCIMSRRSWAFSSALRLYCPLKWDRQPSCWVVAALPWGRLLMPSHFWMPTCIPNFS